MSGRNHGPPLSAKAMSNARLSQPDYEPAFLRGHGGPSPMSHPMHHEEMRESPFRMGGHRHLPHPAILEDRLAGQHHEIQAMLSDNQGLAVVHVALRQELESAHFQLQQAEQYANSLHPEMDVELRELRGTAARLEMEVRGVEGMKAELAQVRADIKELSAMKEDLTGQVDGMTKDLARYKADLEQVPGMKAEIDHIKQELHRARSAIEYEKKGYAQNYEHGQAMEKKLLSMARELEKLRAEINNAEKKPAAAATTTGYSGMNAAAAATMTGYSGMNAAAAAATTTGYSGPTGYNTNYGYAEGGYSGNVYSMNYNVNPVQASAENYPQGAPGLGAWGAYDTQQAQGHR